MDYRHYRGDTPRLPPKLRPFLHLLRPVGIILSILAVGLPMFTTFRFIKSTLVGNLLGYTFMILGPICFLIGLSYDNFVDRSR